MRGELSIFFENPKDLPLHCLLLINSFYNLKNQGDSGGPLVVNQRGKLLQVGIVSYGTHWECGKFFLTQSKTKLFIAKFVDYFIYDYSLQGRDGQMYTSTYRTLIDGLRGL